MQGSDPFEVTATGDDGATAKDGPIDWTTTKKTILANLDVAAEFRELGVKTIRDSAGKKGWIDCYAFDRADNDPSAGINVNSGFYVDLGDQGSKLDLFDFATKHGPYGRWIDAFRHYADKAGVAVGKIATKSSGRIHETTYYYRDADGSVRYAVFRYKTPKGGKTFTQHPPDGKGGWKYGEGCMDAVEPLPYRLPEIVASPAAEIWVFEGEKDCDRAASLGLVSTTNHQGSKSTDKTWPAFASRFSGRICYVVPDNDATGREHARKVAAYLAPVAETVKLVTLDGLPPKGDLSDWLDMGNSKDDLRLLADLAPLFDPNAPAETSTPEPAAPVGLRPGVMTVCFDDVVARPVDWLWPNRVPLGKVTLFAGEAKQGKSFLTIDLASRISVGGTIPCGEGECMPRGSVLFLSAEDDLDDTMKPRLVACGADTSKVHALVGVRDVTGREGMFNLAQIDELEEAIASLGDCKLVVIDPITAYIGGKIDDHKASALRSVLGPLKDLAFRRQVAIVIVTHHNKGNSNKALNRVTGSGAYTALARSNWLICKDPNDPKRRLFLSAGTNLVEDPDGLAYRIDPVEKRIVWEDAPIPMTADDAIDQEREPKGGGGGSRENASKVEQAEAWLSDILSAGKEIPSDEILTQGEGKGFKRDVLFSAKKRIGVKARKGGFHGGWAWYLPSDTSDASDASNSSYPSDASDPWEDGPAF